MKKLTDASVSKPMMFEATPAGALAMSYVQVFHNRMSAKANATPKGMSRTRSVKDQRPNSPPRKQSQLPEPKVGAKANVNGSKAVPVTKRDMKPNLDSALWFGNLRTSIRNDDVIDYITSGVLDMVPDKERLVRNDVDVSTLRFVTFKVEMNADDSKILNDPVLWPQDVKVREFTMKNLIILVTSFPTLKGQNERETPDVSAQSTPTVIESTSNQTLMEI